MKKFIAPLLALSLTFGATAALAGGPVLIEEEGQPEIVAESPRSGWVVPVIVGFVLACAIACGGGDEETATTEVVQPDPEPPCE